jgi:HAD superfamily hydrolase (TIGR01509 family)
MTPARWLFLDFDGTLMDSEPIILPSLIKRFNDLYDFGMTYEDFIEHFHGLSYQALVDAVGRHYKTIIDFNAMFHDREWTTMEACRQHGVKMADDLIETMDALAQHGYKFGVATNNTLQRILAAMRYADNKRGEELAHRIGTHFFQADKLKKPDPDVYLRAMTQCLTDAHHAVAVEDSAAGAAAGVAAGMKTFGFIGFAPHPEAQRKELTALGVTDCFASWKDFPEILKKHGLLTRGG